MDLLVTTKHSLCWKNNGIHWILFSDLLVYQHDATLFVSSVEISLKCAEFPAIIKSSIVGTNKNYTQWNFLVLFWDIVVSSMKGGGTLSSTKVTTTNKCRETVGWVFWKIFLLVYWSWPLFQILEQLFILNHNRDIHFETKTGLLTVKLEQNYNINRANTISW